MKKKFLFLLLALVGMAQLSAQESDYIPFVREGVKWVCFFNSNYNYCGSWERCFPNEDRTYFTLELKGDVVIGDKTYKAMHMYGGDRINEQNDTVPIYLREEDRIVYAIMPDYYPYLYVGYGICVENPAINLVQAARSGEEFILYDFNDPDTYYNSIYMNNGHDFVNYEGCDEIQVGGRKAKRYCFNIESKINMYFIEGIGYDGYMDGYTLGYLYQKRNMPYYHEAYEGFFLSHVIENGDIVYRGINHEKVMPWDGRCPIVQDGKIWVNERVVINQGDTTRSYYSYEIKGDDSEMASCHYYTGQKYDPENDSIISLLCEFRRTKYVMSYYNQALKALDQNQTIMNLTEDCDTNILYWMKHNDAEITIDEYLYKQRSPKVLTEENFIAMDPVEIDGFMCERYAYVNEEGEPMAYLVEGIGFDSWCMGDLLTPFTREPDHGADYQEYCGLSHVIKNGKIIYKGMCYDEKRVQALNGDVNGDGLVNITDVTLLIDMLLNEGPGLLRAHGDVDYSGDINITDVVRLIELALEN